VTATTLPRSGGILLHPTSLPGPGIGDLGPGARDFVEFLASCGLRWWQMLPLGPTGFADSPYQSSSTFAGNPLLISLEDLVDDGLLHPHEIEYDLAVDSVDFEHVIPWKSARLTVAIDRFLRRGAPPEFSEFLDRHGRAWLDEFAVFTALKRTRNDRPWWEWEDGVKDRMPSAMATVSAELGDVILAVKVEQYLFDRDIRLLRERCADRSVRIIGDIPIFVAHDSADVWANRELYLLDERGHPTVVAGVPPDYFSATGQRWGNPLYDWPVHAETGFSWWIRRIRRSLELCDLLRIDHFRGFVAAWHIPAGAPTAVDGEWVAAPGRPLLERLLREFGDLPLIAEDLGVITPEVEALRDDFRLPGMKVLQFGFGTESAHAIDRFREHVVAYTGTHDNDTARGWFDDDAPSRRPERRRAVRELGAGSAADFAWTLVEAVFSSVAAVAIAPLQDVLGLGRSARMNTPGTDTGNWRWRYREEHLTDELLQRLRDLVMRTGRA
jgi:4-alpha-glucanotransferase